MIKRKILVIPGYSIYPIASGGAHGQMAFLDKQQHQFEIHLILTPENINESDIPAFKQQFPKIHLVLLAFKSSKQKGIAAFLTKVKRKFSGKDFAYLMRKVHHINGLFISNPPIIEAIYNYANQNSFDLIQVEHLRNAGLVAILPQDTKKIFVLHEIGYQRVFGDLKSLGYSAPYASYISGFAEGAEVYYIRQYDGVISFNKDDTAALKAKGVKAPVQVASPFALFDNEIQKVYEPAKPPVLIFIGGEEHYPNKEGLTWFIEKIFPLITEKNKNTQLLVTSKWSNDYKNKYASTSITFTGFVEDLNELLANAILVSPIRLGSGIRIKIITSMAKGLPVVSTTLGASGIPTLKDRENLIIADDEVTFANSVIELITNPALRERLSAGAYALAEQNFAATQFVELRNNFYEELWEQEITKA